MIWDPDVFATIVPVGVLPIEKTGSALIYQTNNSVKIKVIVF
jgi:hypothetical protein